MIKIRPLALALTAIVGIAFATAVATPAFAAKKKHRGHHGYRTITVESNYNADTVTGRVRTTSRGEEVQLPSGAWIPCSFGCRDTLRSQTIDFWQWIEENSSGRD